MPNALRPARPLPPGVVPASMRPVDPGIPVPQGREWRALGRPGAVEQLVAALRPGQRLLLEYVTRRGGRRESLEIGPRGSWPVFVSRTGRPMPYRPASYGLTRPMFVTSPRGSHWAVIAPAGVAAAKILAEAERPRTVRGTPAAAGAAGERVVRDIRRWAGHLVPRPDRFARGAEGADRFYRRGLGPTDPGAPGTPVRMAEGGDAQHFAIRGNLSVDPEGYARAIEGWLGKRRRPATPAEVEADGPGERADIPLDETPDWTGPQPLALDATTDARTGSLWERRHRERIDEPAEKDAAARYYGSIARRAMGDTAGHRIPALLRLMPRRVPQLVRRPVEDIDQLAHGQVQDMLDDAPPGTQHRRPLARRRAPQYESLLRPYKPSYGGIEEDVNDPDTYQPRGVPLGLQREIVGPVAWDARLLRGAGTTDINEALRRNPSLDLNVETERQGEITARDMIRNPQLLWQSPGQTMQQRLAQLAASTQPGQQQSGLPFDIGSYTPKTVQEALLLQTLRDQGENWALDRAIATGTGLAPGFDRGQRGMRNKADKFVPTPEAVAKLLRKIVPKGVKLPRRTNNVFGRTRSNYAYEEMLRNIGTELRLNAPDAAPTFPQVPDIKAENIMDALPPSVSRYLGGQKFMVAAGEPRAGKVNAFWPGASAKRRASFASGTGGVPPGVIRRVLAMLARAPVIVRGPAALRRQGFSIMRPDELTADDPFGGRGAGAVGINRNRPPADLHRLLPAHLRGLPAGEIERIGGPTAEELLERPTHPGHWDTAHRLGQMPEPLIDEDRARAEVESRNKAMESDVANYRSILAHADNPQQALAARELTRPSQGPRGGIGLMMRAAKLLGRHVDGGRRWARDSHDPDVAAETQAVQEGRSRLLANLGISLVPHELSPGSAAITANVARRVRHENPLARAGIQRFASVPPSRTPPGAPYASQPAGSFAPKGYRQRHDAARSGLVPGAGPAHGGAVPMALPGLTPTGGSAVAYVQAPAGLLRRQGFSILSGGVEPDDPADPYNYPRDRTGEPGRPPATPRPRRIVLGQGGPEWVRWVRDATGWQTASPTAVERIGTPEGNDLYWGGNTWWSNAPVARRAFARLWPGREIGQPQGTRLAQDRRRAGLAPGNTHPAWPAFGPGQLDEHSTENVRAVLEGYEHADASEPDVEDMVYEHVAQRHPDIPRGDSIQQTMLDRLRHARPRLTERIAGHRHQRQLPTRPLPLEPQGYETLLHSLRHPPRSGSHFAEPHSDLTLPEILELARQGDPDARRLIQRMRGSYRPPLPGAPQGDGAGLMVPAQYTAGRQGFSILSGGIGPDDPSDPYSPAFRGGARRFRVRRAAPMSDALAERIGRSPAAGMIRLPKREYRSATPAAATRQRKAPPEGRHGRMPTPAEYEREGQRSGDDIANQTHRVALDSLPQMFPSSGLTRLLLGAQSPSQAGLGYEGRLAAREAIRPGSLGSLRDAVRLLRQQPEVQLWTRGQTDRAYLTRALRAARYADPLVRAGVRSAPARPGVDDSEMSVRVTRRSQFASGITASTPPRALGPGAPPVPSLPSALRPPPARLQPPGYQAPPARRPVAAPPARKPATPAMPAMLAPRPRAIPASRLPQARPALRPLRPLPSAGARIAGQAAAPAIPATRRAPGMLSRIGSATVRVRGNQTVGGPAWAQQAVAQQYGLRQAAPGAAARGLLRRQQGFESETFAAGDPDAEPFVMPARRSPGTIMPRGSSRILRAVKSGIGAGIGFEPRDATFWRGALREGTTTPEGLSAKLQAALDRWNEQALGQGFSILSGGIGPDDKADPYNYPRDQYGEPGRPPVVPRPTGSLRFPLRNPQTNRQRSQWPNALALQNAGLPPDRPYNLTTPWPFINQDAHPGIPADPRSRAWEHVREAEMALPEAGNELRRGLDELETAHPDDPRTEEVQNDMYRVALRRLEMRQRSPGVSDDELIEPELRPRQRGFGSTRATNPLALRRIEQLVQRASPLYAAGLIRSSPDLPGSNDDFTARRIFPPGRFQWPGHDYFRRTPRPNRERGPWPRRRLDDGSWAFSEYTEDPAEPAPGAMTQQFSRDPDRSPLRSLSASDRARALLREWQARRQESDESFRAPGIQAVLATLRNLLHARQLDPRGSGMTPELARLVRQAVRTPAPRVPRAPRAVTPEFTLPGRALPWSGLRRFVPPPLAPRMTGTPRGPLLHDRRRFVPPPLAPRMTGTPRGPLRDRRAGPGGGAFGAGKYPPLLLSAPAARSGPDNEFLALVAAVRDRAASSAARPPNYAGVSSGLLPGVRGPGKSRGMPRLSEAPAYRSALAALADIDPASRAARALGREADPVFGAHRTLERQRAYDPLDQAYTARREAELAATRRQTISADEAALGSGGTVPLFRRDSYVNAGGAPREPRRGEKEARLKYIDKLLAVGGRNEAEWASKARKPQQLIRRVFREHDTSGGHSGAPLG